MPELSDSNKVTMEKIFSMPYGGKRVGSDNSVYARNAINQDGEVGHWNCVPNTVVTPH